MYKKYKTTNIVLFVIALLVQIYNVVMYVDTLKVINSGTTDALAIIALLPLFIIGTVILFVLSVIMLVVCKRATKLFSDTSAPKIIKILTWIAWAFVIIDVILFILLYII